LQVPVPILHAIVLGIVQGLTEFLPISSSGHLILVPWALGWNDLEDLSVQKAFDVSLHLGTLVAVVAYFWRDLVVYVRDGTKAVVHRKVPPTTEGRLAWLFVLSAIPAALVGALFSGFIEEKLGTPPLIAISLIVFGLLLAKADRLPSRRTIDSFDTRSSLTVGLWQVAALNPGTSRSGITITGARWLGYSRDSAARIGFLMAIPVTLGAIVFKVGGLVVDGIPPGLGWPMVVGIITSGIAGWIAVWGTLRFVRTHSFTVFVIYRLVAGTLVLVVWALGLR
jgi:undecaprenyl-diphosphatase